MNAKNYLRKFILFGIRDNIVTCIANEPVRAGTGFSIPDMLQNTSISIAENKLNIIPLFFRKLQSRWAGGYVPYNTAPYWKCRDCIAIYVADGGL